jgi:hypothetical protein
LDFVFGQQQEENMMEQGKLDKKTDRKLSNFVGEVSTMDGEF